LEFFILSGYANFMGRAHGVPLEKLPKGVSDMIFPYLLLALSDYKTSQIN